MTADDDGLAHRSTTRAMVRQRSGAVLRSFALGVSVFVLAVLTGALLSGAAPATPDSGSSAAEPAEPAHSREASTEAASPAIDVTFAHSMVYSGGAALLVSVAGMVMVGRRRRLW